MTRWFTRGPVRGLSCVRQSLRGLGASRYWRASGREGLSLCEAIWAPRAIVLLSRTVL